ncbi:MAG: DUF1565 domain-containing protein [Acidobacteriota bacterium]
MLDLPRLLAGAATLAVLLLAPLSAAAVVLEVPTHHATIQDAIDAASSGDLIYVRSGRYEERLVLRNKTVSIVGDGMGHTIVHSGDADPLVSIEGGQVDLVSLSLVGSPWDADVGSWTETSKQGIVSKDADLTLANVEVMRIHNYFVSAEGGTLDIANVRLHQGGYAIQADIGLMLEHCEADIWWLQVPDPRIDHVVMVNGAAEPLPPSELRKVVRLTDSEIALSRLSWGDGVVVFSDAIVEVIDNTFVRDVVAGASTVRGIAVSGVRSEVTVRGNFIHRAPIGIQAQRYATNRVRIEHNRIYDSINAGVRLHYGDADAVDLGGGPLGSRGGNQFCRWGASSAVDLRFDSFGTQSLSALGNSWSHPSPPAVIHDHYDDSSLPPAIWWDFFQQPLDPCLTIQWPDPIQPLPEPLLPEIVQPLP